MAMITRNQMQARREAESTLFAVGTTAVTAYAIARGSLRVGPLLQNPRAQDLCQTISSIASSVGFKAAGIAAVLGMVCVKDRFSSHPSIPDQIEQLPRVLVPEIARCLPDEAILAVLKVYPDHPDVSRMAGPALMRLRQKRITQFVRMAEWFKTVAGRVAMGAAVGGILSAGIREIHIATMLRAEESMENIAALRFVMVLTVGMGVQASALPMGARLKLLCKLLGFYTSAMATVGAVSDGKKGFLFGSEVGIMMGLGSSIGSATQIALGTLGADKKIALGILGLGTGSLGVAMGLANPKVRVTMASEAARNALKGQIRHVAGSVAESFGKGAVAGGKVALAGNLFVLPLVDQLNVGMIARRRVAATLSALSLIAGILA